MHQILEVDELVASAGEHVDIVVLVLPLAAVGFDMPVGCLAECGLLERTIEQLAEQLDIALAVLPCVHHSLHKKI